MDPTLHGCITVLQGSIRHDEDDEQENGQYQGGGQGGQGGVSIFQVFNQRLQDAGMPSWNAGPYVVQPIVSIGLLLALMLFGFRGLFFGGMLFLVTKWSMAGDGPRNFINNIGLGGLFGRGRQRARTGGARLQRGNGDANVRSTGSSSWSVGGGGSGHRLGNS